MRLLNRFFYFVISVQNFLKKFEQWYVKIKGKLPIILFLCIVLTAIFITCKNVVLATIVFILGIVFVWIENIIGWEHSVRKWLLLSVVYNLGFSFIVSYILHFFTKFSSLPLFIGTYLLVWVFLSLISDSNVALLVNEIISGIATTIFTIGTYLVSMGLNNKISLNDYLENFSTFEAFEMALSNGDVFAWEFIKIAVLEILADFFLFFLPVIGVTALSIIMIKVKIYWNQKNNVDELEV